MSITDRYLEHTNQYVDFNTLLQEYGGHRLKILAFPCNQFYYAEPGNNNEIIDGITHVRPGKNFTLHPDIHVFSKIDVNGNEQHALYNFLEVH